MNISYDYYRVFYYVAKCRSITQAALQLMSNQPNVTRTIKNLETELGCILFIRSRKGVILTPEGEKLYEHVRIAFEHIEAGEEELAMDQSLQSGTIAIGVSEIALHGLLLPVLKKYRQLYPDIRIRVTNHSTPQALEALKNGLVDIAIVTTPMNLSKSLKSIPIKRFQEVSVCGSAYEFLKDRILTLEEIAEYPLICLGEHTKTYEFYSNLFSEHGIGFSPSVEAATANQILPLVKHDLGIGFVPEMFLNEINTEDNIYRLNLKTTIPYREICVVKRKEFGLSVAAKKLEEMLKWEA